MFKKNIIIIIISVFIISIGAYYGFTRIGKEVLPPPSGFDASFYDATLYSGPVSPECAADPSMCATGELSAVILGWYSVEEAEFYRIYRSKNSKGPWEKVFEGVGSAFDDPEDGKLGFQARDFDFPRDFTTLYYYITAVDSQGREGKPSKIVSVRRP